MKNRIIRLWAALLCVVLLVSAWVVPTLAEADADAPETAEVAAPAEESAPQADEVEAAACVHAAAKYDGPVYIRFGRAAVPVINEPGYTCEIGKATVVREGKDVTIAANGLCFTAAMEAAEMLAADGIDAEVINFCTVKPLDEAALLASAKKTGKVVTAEEHSIIGGLGSAVAECLSEKLPTPLCRIGVRDVFGESGPFQELLHKYELDAEGVYKQVKVFLK